MENIIKGIFFGMAATMLMLIIFVEHPKMAYERGVKDCMNGEAKVVIQNDTLITAR